MERTITFADGVKVCTLGQGTWKMGQSASRRNEELKALRRGLDLGLSVIDTAGMYGNEEFVGEAIRGQRDKAFIVSKVLPSNASYKGTKLACERSLRKLGIECIDLYLLHWIGHHPFAETVRAMEELRQAGKIARWGMSNLDVADMEQILSLPGGTHCAANQVLYNLKERGVEFDLLPWSMRHAMPVMAYTPIGEGSLRNHPLLKRIAQKHNATPTQIALAWVMRNPGVMAIPKASGIGHVEENFRSLSISLSEDDLDELDSVFPAPQHKIPLAGW